MTITIIGTGFVGVVSSAVYAKFKNKVFGLDIDAVKINSLNQGIVPFHEPKLTELVSAGISSGLLKFTTSYQEAIPTSDVIIIAVGTPSAKDGNADLTYVFKAAESIAPLLQENAIVAIKSTVPPGTNKLVYEKIKSLTNTKFHVASSPEFLREGSAVDDTLNPDRILIGTESEFAAKVLVDLHKPFNAEKLVMLPESAQMAKYTANAYLAQRITFVNQIANLCEKNGASISEVIKAIGLDKRIGSHYWYPGLGYGGSCFPKDVKELASYSKSVGESYGLLVKIDELNEKRIYQKLSEFESAVGGFNGKTIAVLGLSFKPNTNDMREAPSLKIIPELQKKKAIIKAYDPKAMTEAQKIFPHLFYGQDVYETITSAEVIILLTEWPELVHLDLAKVKALVNTDCVFIDTRNQYNKKDITKYGLKYLCIGNG